MNDDKNERGKGIKGFFSKLKSVKNIELIVCIILIAIILLLYGIVREAKKKEDGSAGETSLTGTLPEAEDECEKLEKILSEIKGAGNVRVYIGYEGTGEVVYVYDRTVNTTVREDDSGGANMKTTVTEEKTTPVFTGEGSSKTPLVEKTNGPKIQGVVIVAEGAADIKVRLELMEATAAALNIDEKIIKIFIMK